MTIDLKFDVKHFLFPIMTLFSRFMLFHVVGRIDGASETTPENFALTPAMNLLANESGLRKLSSYSPAV
jgi:hypothetical protein